MSKEKNEDVCLECTEEGVEQTIANWAEVPVSSVHENTKLDGLGGKTYPDIALARMLSQLCPESAEKIMADYPLWSIVRDAVDDCLGKSDHK